MDLRKGMVGNHEVRLALLRLESSKPKAPLGATFSREIACLHAIFCSQQGGKFIDAKPLKGFGAARVLEVVEDWQSDTFRCVYSVKFAGAVYVLHTFQKKSKIGSKTPKPEIDLVKERLKRAEEHYREWSTK